MKWFVECKCRKTAVKRHPDAAVIVKCDGGYMAFSHVTDYEIWKNQK